ncbi:MAG: hypothetical protein ABR549_08620 [Mycobacteriales bacterium]
MTVADVEALTTPAKTRRRRQWAIAAVLVLVVVGGVGALSLRSHAIHQRAARALERDLLTYLPKVPGVRVMPETLRHWVTGQEGGSSDCEADATVQVATSMSANDLANVLNDTTPILATTRTVRPGVVLVQNYTPLGSSTWDWDC